MKYNVEMFWKKEKKESQYYWIVFTKKGKIKKMHGREAASENERNPDCSSKQILTKGSLCYW